MDEADDLAPPRCERAHVEGEDQVVQREACNPQQMRIMPPPNVRSVFAIA